MLLLSAISCKDSTLKVSTTSASDSISVYLASAKNIEATSEQRIKFNESALRILLNQSNTPEYREKLNSIAEQFYSLGAGAHLKKTLKLAIKKALEKKDSIHVARAFNIFGNQYINEGRNDSAYFYLLKSEKIFTKLKDSTDLGKNYIDKAFVQLSENDFSGTELSAIQALSYYKNSNKRLKEYYAYNMIGISSNELKNYDNALIYHKKALEYANLYEEIRNSKKHYRASTYNNIGYVYLNLHMYEEAIKNFRKGLAEPNLLLDNAAVYSAIVDNLAYSKFKLKDYSNLPGLFLESLRIREENGNNSGIIANKIHLSEFFAAKKDTLNSQKYANEALKLASKTNVSGDLLGSLKQLSLVEHRNSSQYSKEYIRISDSLQIEERKSKDKFARIAFETDEIIVEKDKLVEQNRSLLYFFLGLLFVGILLFVIRTQRAKNRELLLKQQQQKANEDIYNLMISQQSAIEDNRVKEKKRIAQELHDGVLGRLFGARLNLDSLNKYTDDRSIQTRFNYLEELKNIEQDIREISHDLNREKFVLINNFVAIVHNLLEEQKSSFNPNLKFTMDERIKWDAVSNAVKINLYRILQESLQNINKYAEAKNIDVKFTTLNELIILEVIDDGLGFDLHNKKKGIGLQNMQSRSADCQGTFDVKSKKGKGTTITISMPIENQPIELNHDS